MCVCSNAAFKPAAQEKDVYMVCGLLKSGAGHCDVGVSTIEPNNDNFFGNFMIFEPQSGVFKGFFQEFANGWKLLVMMISYKFLMTLSFLTVLVF